jgi:hypothetical protein
VRKGHVFLGISSRFEEIEQRVEKAYKTGIPNPVLPGGLSSHLQLSPTMWTRRPSPLVLQSNTIWISCLSLISTVFGV